MRGALLEFGLQDKVILTATYDGARLEADSFLTCLPKLNKLLKVPALYYREGRTTNILPIHRIDVEVKTIKNCQSRAKNVNQAPLRSPKKTKRAGAWHRTIDSKRESSFSKQLERRTPRTPWDAMTKLAEKRQQCALKQRDESRAEAVFAKERPRHICACYMIRSNGCFGGGPGDS